MSGEELAERIDFLLSQKNISKSNFYEVCDLSNNSLTKWKQGAVPNSDALYRVSSFLNVSMDFLMTGKEENGLSQTDLQLLNDFHSLTSDLQNVILKHISELSSLCKK